MGTMQAAFTTIVLQVLSLGMIVVMLYGIRIFADIGEKICNKIFHDTTTKD
jgi:hypothetical protein